MTRRQHTTYPFSNDTWPDGISLEVEFNYYPGSMGYRNSFGEQEEPDNPAEIEITLVELGSAEFTLSDSELKELEKFIWAKINSKEFAD